jgi:hypothetical protein
MGPYVQQAKEFARQMLDEFHIGERGSRNSMLIVGFDTRVIHLAQLRSFTTNRQHLQQQIGAIRSHGGTSFLPGIQHCVQTWQAMPTNAQRVVLFQTDGHNGDRGRVEATARQLVNDLGVTVAGVIVGQGPGIQELVGFAGHFDDRGRAHNELIIQTRDYAELVARVAEVAAAVQNAT